MGTEAAETRGNQVAGSFATSTSLFIAFSTNSLQAAANPADPTNKGCGII
jgi:hypothetical protein